MTGAVNEDAIAVLRSRIGIPIRRRQRFHNEVCSSDSFRHYAFGYGDDNPLYCDPDNGSLWGGVIAPPTYPVSAGRLRAVEWTEAEAAVMGGGDPLAGVGQYMCGERWIFVRPVHPGEQLVREQSLFDAQLKPSSFGGGVGALVSHRISWALGDGSPVCYRFLDFWHAEREESARAGKYRDLERPHYTDEDLAAIDACYAAEQVRGSTPRLAADVEVGMALGPMAKGPLSLTDIICHHVGVGFGVFGGGAARLGYKSRQRIPKFYEKNSLGFWDTVQRCHWEDEWAQTLGHPAAYDYGLLRTNWMVHLITDWMGDDAWLWSLSSSTRHFGYLGDTHRMSGEVVSADRTTGRVELSVRGVNQRGVATCEASAIVFLPTTAGQLAAIPEFDPSDIPVAQSP
jgi:acyl dehydratase